MQKKTELPGFYEDQYFKPGHKLLKIKEGFITLIGWGFVMGLMTLVLVSSMSHIDKKLPHLFPNTAGFYEVNRLGMILLIFFIASLLISIFLTIMNNYRNESFYDTVSVLDKERERKRERLYQDFVTKRFGAEDMRHSVSIYNVKPEQCLPINTYQKLYNEHHLNDVD